MTLLTFANAIAEAQSYNQRHLLLGNGFSIACRPDIFQYGKLYEEADFSKLSPTAKLAFEALGTQDFERVIKALRDTKKILSAYGGVAESFLDMLESDANGLRELLVQTIANSHPSFPGELTEVEYAACREFISHFTSIYTFNYDLLLYWVLMHTPEGEDSWSDDGFRKSSDDYDADYVVWEPSQSHEQNTHFLHGALHVFDAGTEIQKYTWNNTGVRLIDQIRHALSKDFYPIFVSEGTSAEKYERIRHNDYLAKAYRSFCSIGGALFIYGHSLAENDEHYIKRIEKGKIAHVYIGLYGDPLSEANKRITRRANQMINARRGKVGLSVSYFDASSAKVWGK
ncbi:DUF4917 family protein [Undibacterium seohonense]|uniref:DUF4917 family protein n=1 Tax=Undibacterium seohonense TaxID=1344950 RepID=A0ABR6X1W5_9BURK|nr:DUF4917 family protein [Undibacterium seohonense]MBC3806618.1 DUF4917 family protein [Undibacterium seohonense]